MGFLWLVCDFTFSFYNNLQIKNWAFCDTLWDPYGSSGNETQCLQRRADYIDKPTEFNEKVLEIQFNITIYGDEDDGSVRCFPGENGFAPHCTFGKPYSVNYFETVRSIFSSLIQGLRLIPDTFPEQMCSFPFVYLYGKIFVFISGGIGLKEIAEQSESSLQRNTPLPSPRPLTPPQFGIS